MPPTLSAVPVSAAPADVPAADAVPVLSARAIQRLALADATLVRLRAARDADPDERQRLLDLVVTDHLWLAETMSRRFRFRGEDEEDLLQVARTGLVEACRRFDPDQGAFLGFAVPTISGVLKRHFRDHGWMVRPPRRTQELASSLWQQWPDLVQGLGAIPSERELADTLGEPVTAVRQARYASQGYTSSSLDAALLQGVGFGVEDAETERCEARLVVDQVWSQLTATERQLLRMRFFEQRSQSDIADEIGTSQMQVSRLLARLMTKLRGLIGTLDDCAAAAGQVA